MRFLSLFAGIGGMDLGLERAGWTSVGQVEVDPYCRHVLERHWPDVWRWGDVRLVDGDTIRAACGRVDAVVGGFPCQDISLAGSGAGIDGRRSGLWADMFRLVHELRPRWVLVENVPALRTRGGDRVLTDLEAEGYACWPLVVGAWTVGAPHRRDRVWIVGRPAHAAGERGGPSDLQADPGAAGAGARGLSGNAGADRVGLADACRNSIRDVEQRVPARRPRGVRDEGEAVAGADGSREGASGDEPDGRGERGRWPARPGCPQHEWEAPRTLESGVGRAAPRLSRRLAGVKHAETCRSHYSEAVPALWNDDSSPSVPERTRAALALQEEAVLQSQMRGGLSAGATSKAEHALGTGVEEVPRQRALCDVRDEQDDGHPSHRWEPGEQRPAEHDEAVCCVPYAMALAAWKADAVSPRIRRLQLKALGNSVVPQVVEQIGRAILQIDGWTR